MTQGKKQITIFTLGHSTHSLETFIEILKHYHITQLVDVRTIPQSRHNPQFNKDNLAHELEKENITYIHLKELGGLRPAKPNSVNTAWHNASFRGFADYMQTTTFEHGIQQLIDAAQSNVVCIMCAEAVPWRCHRSLIADALVIRGIMVKEIFSVSSVKPHILTPWAHIEGTSLTYPASKLQKTD